MWIVRLALNRPYTFIVLALLIFIISPVMISRTPTDIFPSIDIPVISVAWQYAGLNSEELEGRLTTAYEKALTALVDNIQHIESTTYSGTVVVKIFLQPTASLDTANAQVGAASEFMLRSLPPGTLPPEINNFSASSVPVLQIGLSGSGLSEQQLNDASQRDVRPQLITVPGAVVPNPYGGKQRQIMVNMDQKLMQEKGVSATDVLNAVNAQNVVVPSGTVKIGTREYDVRPNAAVRSLQEISDIPIKQVGNTTIFVRDVAVVSDGFAVQTNIVRQDGHRSVLVAVVKNGHASTLDVVQGVKNMLPRIAAIVPPELKMTLLSDQSIFVRGAIGSVIREAVIAAALTGLMILLFLGSWRSTVIIATSIPLSILTSVIVLSLLHETINIMTLGGLALAVGILVDDATVEVENIHRNLAMGKPLTQAILDGAQQIAVPAFVATLCICIVFLPMFMLGGVARYLFVPLAEAVIFAMLASYILSRTLVPTLAMYLLKAHEHDEPGKGFLGRMQLLFEHGFERIRRFYCSILNYLVGIRHVFVPIFLTVCVSFGLLIPWLGQDFFPSADSGEILLHMRGSTGLRIEETARLCDLVEGTIRKVIPKEELASILDNIGMPYSPMNTMHMTSGAIGPSDADILISLHHDHHPTADYLRILRKRLAQDYPGTTFYALPADIVTQILNFGIPAPMDIQLECSDGQIPETHAIATKMLADLRKIPGLVDLRVQQPMDFPTLDIAVNRAKALQSGFTQHNIANVVLNTLSGSMQVTPMFFLNQQNGVNYNLVAQVPQYRMQSLGDLENMPILSNHGSEILGDLATIHRAQEMQIISQYNIRPVIDIYGTVQDRDLGAVSREVQKIVDQTRKELPRGTFITLRGQVKTMHDSYVGLLAGLAFAILLLYMLIVINFQSWLDPLIIITALPAALAGIILALLFTHTTISVPALMGAIMCMGVATANSILVISFAKERFIETGDAVAAALEAGATRFRPVIMTALAMMIGMVPMALGLGEGGEQNAPLGRAVIGGLLCATIATLIFVPAVFSLLYRRNSVPA
ncbi:acriflavin resistance protein [Chthoniobacter flavus Ellin428]|uniref:Acriflavin resistance protein n=1 Tax=Chthoniobacter flavus Ellin428 TaxID=497964 RepID=B4CWM3_9BACT|nr:efflux RND transporter permease subunit [Chthoniobacter flavus]EDY21815.1 acriflavin resistance protein [Chthoniobacter flavus Ellin428]TCO95743.1 multidrug efflux pump subunit AcrB [Chthoniobacter flavus]